MHPRRNIRRSAILPVDVSVAGYHHKETETHKSQSLKNGYGAFIGVFGNPMVPQIRDPGSGHLSDDKTEFHSLPRSATQRHLIDPRP